MLVYLFVCFLVIVLAIVAALLFYLKSQRLPSAQNLAPDPNVVICSENDILEAWIRNYPPRQNCPTFTNNYVVDDQYQMYQKDFQVDPVNKCCWYSNQSDQRELFPNPWICIGSDRIFSLNQLNDKPYSFNGVETRYPNPACDNDPKCIAMIRAGLDTSGNGIYKLTKFRTESTNTYETLPGQAVPPPDSSADYARRLTFYLGPSCLSLEKITIDQQLLLKKTPDGYIWYDSNPALRPVIVTTIYQMFLDGRFYPISGANPPLSIAAANYI